MVQRATSNERQLPVVVLSPVTTRHGTETPEKSLVELTHTFAVHLQHASVRCDFTTTVSSYSVFLPHLILLRVYFGEGMYTTIVHSRGRCETAVAYVEIFTLVAVPVMLKSAQPAQLMEAKPANAPFSDSLHNLQTMSPA